MRGVVVPSLIRRHPTLPTLPLSNPEESIASTLDPESGVEGLFPKGPSGRQQVLHERDIVRYFYKIADTVGVLEKLTAGKPVDTRNLFFEAVKRINFVVYEVDHKTEDLEHFETWDDLRDLLAFIDEASAEGLQIDALGFMQYLARQLSMYDVEHRIIHGKAPRSEAQDYVGRFFDDRVDYVDTGYYYSLARENGLITAAAVRHGHNISKAFDVVDAVEDYDEDKLSNNYPPFILYMLHHDSEACPRCATRPVLPLILERGAASIAGYREALRADTALPRAESEVFEEALDFCGRELLTAGKSRSQLLDS